MTPNPSSGSVNFDRAAGYYDQSRKRSPWVDAQTAALLCQELAGRGRCLEIGVGTGRIGLPLHNAGIDMAGVDISPLMLERLVEKAGGRPPFPLALADATALPFGGATFGAGVAAHVFHLIPPWRGAVAELVRVVRPGGVVVVQLTERWGEPYREVRQRLVAAGGLDRIHLGVRDAAELDEAFASHGVPARELPKVIEVNEISLEVLIADFEKGTFSYTWRIDEQARRRAAAEVRAWARTVYGSLDELRPARSEIGWRAYDLPGRPGRAL